jgi:hypothetical protein
MWKASVCTALVVSGMLGLACCSSDSSSKASAWCGLKLGATRDEALAAMGVPQGSKVTSQVQQPLRTGWSNLEWDQGTRLFYALFDATGRAVRLQAYDGAVGPAGAHGLSCQPFRTSSQPVGGD